MPTIISLPLSNIIPVSVVVSPAAVPGLTFNQGLIVGSSTVIPSQGANSRLREYFSLTSMLTDGFLTSSPEYLAAEIYFGQSPAPTQLWIGRQNITALNTITVGSSGGTGYVVNDILTVVQSGGSNGLVLVTTIGGSGAVTGVSIIQGSQGSGYSVASNLATTGGSGTGAEINITVIGETPVQAIEACRLAQPTWYACMFVGTAADADYEAIAGFVEAATPATVFFLTSGEAAILNGTTGNLFSVLQALNYRRTFMMYSTTQGGTFPNNIYASAAPMGLSMGLNTGAAGSYFDPMFKPISGVGPEPLTQTQVTTICGSVDRSNPGLNGNVYLNYQNGSFAWAQNCTMCSGTFFDETLNLDMIVNDMQVSGVNLLTSLPALPITNSGVTQMANVISGALDRSQQRGFVAPSGIWQGIKVGTGANAVGPGTALPNGYFVYFPPVSSLSAQARGARQLPPFTVLLIESGSGHSLSVTIEVQR